MRSILYILFSLLSTTVFGQVSDLIFIGAATLKGNTVFTYKLQVSDSAGIVKGYSVTDIMGADETKTAVKGTVDQKKKQMVITETKMISTKSSAPRSEFCYIRARLNISQAGGATILKGHFDGYKEDGKTPCASGKLMLANAQDVLGKLLEIADTTGNEKKPEVAEKKNTEPSTIVYSKETPASEIAKLMPGKSLEIVVADAKVVLDVWDSENIDGDMISIYNGKNLILDHYTISGRSKQLKIDMGGNNTETLTLVAINEGSEPNNTARIRLTSGGSEHFVDATTTIDKQVTIVLKRKN